MASSLVTKRIFSLFLYIAMAFVVAYVLIDRHPPTLAVGSPAPLDTKISLLSGGKTSVRRFLAQPLVVNFWAGWCAPCLKELPVFSRLAKKYRGQIGFLGPALATDVDDIFALRGRFVIDYELALVSDEVVDIWQARALPTTYIINRQGIIVWAKTGITSEEELGAALQLVLGR